MSEREGLNCCKSFNNVTMLGRWIFSAIEATTNSLSSMITTPILVAFSYLKTTPSKFTLKKYWGVSKSQIGELRGKYQEAQGELL